MDNSTVDGWEANANRYFMTIGDVALERLEIAR